MKLKMVNFIIVWEPIMEYVKKSKRVKLKTGDNSVEIFMKSCLVDYYIIFTGI